MAYPSNFASNPSFERFPPATPERTSPFIQQTSNSSILNAVNLGITSAEYGPVNYLLVVVHELHLFHWIFDCAPPCMDDFIVFLMQRWNILPYFCTCSSSNLGAAMHYNHCMSWVMQNRLVVSSKMSSSLPPSNCLQGPRPICA